MSAETVLKIMNHLNDIPNVPLLQRLGCSKLSHRLGLDHFHPDPEQEGGKKIKKKYVFYSHEYVNDITMTIPALPVPAASPIMLYTETIFKNVFTGHQFRGAPQKCQI